MKKKSVSLSNILRGGNKDLMSVTWSKKGNHQTFGGTLWRGKEGGNYQKVTNSEFCTSKTAETGSKDTTSPIPHHLLNEPSMKGLLLYISKVKTPYYIYAILIKIFAICPNIKKSGL